MARKHCMNSFEMVVCSGKTDCAVQLPSAVPSPSTSVDSGIERAVSHNTGLVDAATEAVSELRGSCHPQPGEKIIDILGKGHVKVVLYCTNLAVAIDALVS